MLTSSSRVSFLSPKCLGAAMLCLGISAQAQASQFSFDPTAIGLSGSAFTADDLKATEVSTILNDASGSFTEHGFAQVTTALNNTVDLAPGGLNSTYSLYAEFTGTGHATSPATSDWDTISLSLYAVTGVSSFFSDANHAAQVNNNGNSPILLGSSSTVIQGSGTAGFAGVDGGTGLPLFNLTADLTADFAPTAAGSLVFGSTADSVNLLGHFIHNGTIGIPNGFGGISAFLVNGGEDTLSLVATSSSSVATVPLPGSIALFAAGLALMGGTSLRKRAAIQA